MQKLEYEIDGKIVALNVPGSFEEMTGDQFREAIKLILEKNKSGSVSQKLTGLPKDVISCLDNFEIFSINEMFDFIYQQNLGELKFRQWKIPVIDLNEEIFYGPTSNFGNITWEEFIYTDQCMINGYYTALIAALYRPERDGYNGETDRRIPFSIYGTTSRFAKFEQLDESDKLAILVNYKSMRRASFEEAYPEIFPFYDNSDNDDHSDEIDDDEGKQNDKPMSFSWTRIHRNLLGDNIQEEEKYLNLNVHTVLNRLNELIIENRKYKK